MNNEGEMGGHVVVMKVESVEGECSGEKGKCWAFRHVGGEHGGGI